MRQLRTLRIESPVRHLARNTGTIVILVAPPPNGTTRPSSLPASPTEILRLPQLDPTKSPSRLRAGGLAKAPDLR